MHGCDQTRRARTMLKRWIRVRIRMRARLNSNFE